MNRDLIEAQLAELPIYQYAFINTEDLLFSERIRWICEHECSMYGKTWACPPAVGTTEECRARIMAYREGLLITTINEVSDIANLEETLATRVPHEEITRKVNALLRNQGLETFALSTEACAICEKCAYPCEKCRFPEKMFPCVESHGIVVTDLAEKNGIEFYADANLVTWFSLILYK